MANQEHFDLVLMRIAADPTSFDMSRWYREDSCGTHACLAGHAVLEAGYEVILEQYHDEGRLMRRADSVWVDGCSESIEDAAQDWLGLTCAQAERMFHGGPLQALGYSEQHAPTNVEELSMRWKAVTSG